MQYDPRKGFAPYQSNSVYKKVRYNKRYTILDQQIAQHFVQYIEGLSTTLAFYATQIINSILKSMISANHDIGL